MSTNIRTKRNTTILAIETSCDETAAAVLTVAQNKFNLRANIIASQIAIHRRYGGVVPEVAARNHVGVLLPVIDEALAKARVTPRQIDRIAVTNGPGLVTSLLVGIETARTLSYLWNKPIVPVNHVVAHLYANWLNNRKIAFPAIGLIVSGGHTELVLIKSDKQLTKIGQTIDDAAGEAFDKVGKLLGLGYPGGPEVSRRAHQGNTTVFDFPRPMEKSGDLRFSFSGLKTAVLYAAQKIQALDTRTINNICASFQLAVVDVLIKKTMAAANQYNARTILLAGGVAANTLLRHTLKTHAEKEQYQFLMPELAWCTDNAAMIAVAGYFGTPIDRRKLSVDPNLSI